MPVIHNEAQSRYEMNVDGQTAVVTYHRDGNVLSLDHTLVPDAIGGRGIGGHLVKGALDDIRARGLKIRPRCSFIVKFIERHPDYKAMVAE